MHRLFGIETEYGIHVEGAGPAELIDESMALVRSYAGRYVTGWNYRGEDSRRDMRGYTVDKLAVNPDDAQFDAPGAPTRSMAEEHSDRILINGARLYNDHGHPEYSTPECASLLELVAHDRAGERVVWECARRRMASGSREISLYKNNTDFHGASYGTHECYLMRRDVPVERLIAGTIPYLVTRQIFAGAGRAGSGAPNEAALHLSQRAEHVQVEASVDTLHNRPLFNTRDEPHATPSRYRRLHVIVGDANMCEWATAMKVGTMALVLQLLEQGWAPSITLKNPVQAVKQISGDTGMEWMATLESGRSIYAIDIQREYLRAARDLPDADGSDSAWVLAEWDKVLTDLADDPESCADRIDWAAKKQLLTQFVESEAIPWGAPVLQSLDLAYHNIDPEVGLFYALDEAGSVRRLVSSERIGAAMHCAPMDTRAGLRAIFIDRMGSAITSIGWNGIAFRHNSDDMLFDLNPLVENNVRVLNEELAATTTPAELVAAIAVKPDSDKS